jgi:class 3 adenylate cyclase
MIRCPSCREMAPPGARFCPLCGVPLARPVLAATGHAGEEADHVAARLELPGERKHVTVLFADVTASMAVLTSHDVEEAAALFDRVIDHMTEAVRRWEGTVVNVLGDGILALFGAPVAQEDHALRACHAALRMQERINAFGDAAQRAHGIPIQIRVGLNSGEVVLRALGADPGALSAVGQTVHVASRMEQLAKPGTILVTSETLALCGDRVRTRALGPVHVKGLADPIEVFEVVGASGGLTRAETPARAEAPLVGREAELGELTTLLEIVRQGPGQMAAVVGEPGIGKTRLVQEFLRLCQAAGCLIFEAAAQPFTRATGHRTGLDIVRSYFGIDRADPLQSIRDKVPVAMLAIAPELADSVPAMLWQLGALEEAHPFWQLDPATRRQRAFEANFRLIGAEARRRTFVLVLENLQWIDADAEDSLRLFAKGLTPFTLVLVTYRPEYDDRWLAHASAVRMHLDPLGPALAARLLDGLLGTAPDLAPLKGLLIERAGGNPFFLEESVRDLAQSGGLSGERGRYRLERPVTAIHVPSTVRSVLEARIDRLPSEDKRVLQCAAVIGERVPSALLEGVAELSGEQLLASLARLRQAEFLEEQALFPEPVHAFRHALTHDVAYGSLLHDRRRALHARALAALERRHAAAPADVVETLAHHALHAELWEEAVRYSRQAGARTSGSRDAVAFFQQALAALGHLPDDDEHRALGIDLRDELARVLVPLGEHPRIVLMLREAQALAGPARWRSCPPRTGRWATPRARSRRASAPWPWPSAPASPTCASWRTSAWVAPRARWAITDAPSPCSAPTCRSRTGRAPPSTSDWRGRPPSSRAATWPGAWPSWASSRRRSSAPTRRSASRRRPPTPTARRMRTSPSAAPCCGRDGWPRPSPSSSAALPSPATRRSSSRRWPAISVSSTRCRGGRRPVSTWPSARWRRPSAWDDWDACR